MSDAAAFPGSGAMFDHIARRYDLLNRMMSLGLDQRWRRILLDRAGARPARVLDVATGTGDVAIAAARRWSEAEILGLDPSKEMLAIAALKVQREGLEPRIRLIEGDAQALTLENESFDLVTIAFGIRNVPDRARALGEMNRVLKPGGTLAILELGEPSDGPLVAAARAYVHGVVPALGAMLSSKNEYEYLAKSIAAFPSANEFARQIAEAEFREVSVHRLMLGGVHVFVAEKGR
jgi:demethylmenaquinone methyltransferase/2-methoxy-6-polyprenyl-1,4-benzoquinol methylase